MTMSFEYLPPEDQEQYIALGIIELQFMVDNPVEAYKRRPKAFYVPLGDVACHDQVQSPHFPDRT